MNQQNGLYNNCKSEAELLTAVEDKAVENTELELYQSMSDDETEYRRQAIASEDLLADANENLVVLNPPEICSNEVYEYCSLTEQEITDFEFRLRANS